MSAREWTVDECKNEWASVVAGYDSMGEVDMEPIAVAVGRALLTLRHERGEAKADLAECYADLGKMTEKWMDACHERDLLAAECRAGRADKKYANCASEEAYQLARAAVDAAGVLGREER